MNLNKKVILVTGGSGLIGKEIINHITSQNGIAINLDIRCEDNLENRSLLFDVTNESSIYKGIDRVLSFYGKIDGLVNNAYPKTDDWINKLEDVSSESFIKNVEMQLSQIFSVSKPVLQIMKKQKKGSLVNIASIYGMVGNDFSLYEGTGLTSPVAYSAIKGGLINLNRYFASYFGKYNVRSNCVSPGGIYNNQNPDFVKRYNNKVPMKRMGEATDIAPIVSFLLSDSAKYITGQNIAVDGGWTSI
jgi:NAD(P)-dependent dehydrogenase (short-subunit alcohol dehydrogenase family)